MRSPDLRQGTGDRLTGPERRLLEVLLEAYPNEVPAAAALVNQRAPNKGQYFHRRRTVVIAGWLNMALGDDTVELTCHEKTTAGVPLRTHLKLTLRGRDKAYRVLGCDCPEGDGQTTEVEGPIPRYLDEDDVPKSQTIVEQLNERLTTQYVEEVHELKRLERLRNLPCAHRADVLDLEPGRTATSTVVGQVGGPDLQYVPAVTYIELASRKDREMQTWMVEVSGLRKRLRIAAVLSLLGWALAGLSISGVL